MQLLISPEDQNKAGIYAIRNNIDNRIYVGSAQKLISRYYAHKSSLLLHAHHAARLQQFVGQHGIHALRFELLELVEVGQELGALEQKWLTLTKAQEARFGFNSTDYARPRKVAVTKTRLTVDVTAELLEDLESVQDASGLSSIPETVRFLLIEGLGRYRKRLVLQGPCREMVCRTTAPVAIRRVIGFLK